MFVQGIDWDRSQEAEKKNYRNDIALAKEPNRQDKWLEMKNYLFL